LRIKSFQGEVVTMHFDAVVKEMRKVAGPGRVTTVSYSGLKFALDCGIDVADHGTPEQKIRLQQEIFAGRRSSENVSGR
jgi:hypothetical protein